jgi:AcrR family transcriptional regulator
MVFDRVVATRLTRPQQVERNRDLVLEAARQVFGEAGYAKATLEAIAERAGFSKGVVYSQFDSKADLFLALVERRIDERAAQNLQLVDGLAPDEAVAAFLRVAEQDAVAAPEWQRVLVEFRAQATRDPELNRRYSELHRRTVERLSAMLDGLYAAARVAPEVPTRVVASFVLAVGSGLTLERAADPGGLPTQHIASLVVRALGLERRTP